VAVIEASSHIFLLFIFVAWVLVGLLQHLAWLFEFLCVLRRVTLLDHKSHTVLLLLLLLLRLELVVVVVFGAVLKWLLLLGTLAVAMGL